MKSLPVKSLLAQENVKKRFEEILGKRAAGFTANLAVMVNNNGMLSNCDPMSIVTAAIVSASLDLPLDPNLGFAAIVPYGDKAQFQIMYKGLVQLAMRSGQYQTINVSEIKEGELVSQNKMTGEYEFDFTNQPKSDKIVGYVAYFRLVNGFQKVVYWPIEDIEKHGKRYSKTYARGKGRWTEDFDAMAKKTVLKALLSKWGILSIEMQTAVKFDQAVVTEDQQAEYVDNDNEPIEQPIDMLEEKANESEPQKTLL